MKTTLSQMMKTAALLGLFALLCPRAAHAVDFAERSAVTPGVQLKLVTLDPKIGALGKPGDGISIDPLAAQLHNVLTAAGLLTEAPGQIAILTIPQPLATISNGPKAANHVGTPAETSQARLAEIPNISPLICCQSYGMT